MDASNRYQFCLDYFAAHLRPPHAPTAPQIPPHFAEHLGDGLQFLNRVHLVEPSNIQDDFAILNEGDCLSAQ
jgi:hypothetical protein